MVYDLPETLEIAGKEYDIRTDYRDILRILIAQGDPDLPDEAKAIVTLVIMYPDLEKIPTDDLQEAFEKAVWFLNCGQELSESKKKPKLMDWEQDSQLIITAINAQIKQEVRSMPYMHWWTFFGYYMSIGESLFSTVVGIRSKRAKGKKLEQHEKEFLKENEELVTLKKKVSESDKAAIRQEKDEILKFLNGGG